VQHELGFCALYNVEINLEQLMPTAEPTGARDITGLLLAIRSGDRQAESELLAKIYPELHRIANALMHGERPGHTLQATGLVNEAYIRLAGSESAKLLNRVHFFAVAAHVMRQILVDHARARLSAKRGAHYRFVEWDETLKPIETRLEQVLEIDELLMKLSSYDSRQARVTEMKMFAGLSDLEIAEVLGVNVRTIKRDWSMAKAWLHGQLVSNGHR
jgi:RNA polymerase sigma-70 factor (ECF subfamily)